ncbi:dihydrofolate reductase-like domain-containing protein [Astrocystis sublimbata]|nr:dihydrofolate reductase-like domain-containing protein [Astrocystis sublimbata]
MAEAQAEEPLYFAAADRARLEPHLPPPPPPSSSSHHHASSDTDPDSDAHSPLPFATLTFATSLDSALALGPGIRTALSGPQSKAMTHYLRSRHDAILVGVGTAIADDPGLNCRLAAADDGNPPHALTSSHSKITSRQPRPFVVDPRLRWDFTAQSKVLRLVREGKGLAPYIITLKKEPSAHKRDVLEAVGGKIITLDAVSESTHALDWHAILAAVRREGLRSIMIEGGGEVINSLLGANATLVDSVIVTIAPTWLGQGGVTVCPPRTRGADAPVARLSNTTWLPLGDDVVLCGKIAP